MVCYYHNDCEAVAQCKNCGKYICKECVYEYEGQMVCPDCAQAINKDVKKYNKQSKWQNFKLVILCVFEIVLSLIALICARGLASTLFDKFVPSGSLFPKDVDFWYVVVFLSVAGIPGALLSSFVMRTSSSGSDRIVSEISALRIDNMGCLGLLVYYFFAGIFGNIFTISCVYTLIKIIVLSFKSKKTN